MGIKFQITARDGAARTGVIHTDHGVVHTPTVTVNFTPAMLRTGLTPQMVRGLGVELVLVNTLHAHLADIQNIHQSLDWTGPVMADSGGFQMISLADKLKIDQNGVEFEIDGRRLEFTPKRVLEIQRKIGVDLMMPLDYVVSVRRHNFWLFLKAALKTNQWFKPAYDSGHNNLYYIVQGGTSSLARAISLAYARYWLNKKQVQAVALGGISLGESSEAIHRTVEFCCKRLPENKPRHLLGVGRPIDLVRGTQLGIDTFDCVTITREARHGRIWTGSGLLHLKQARYLADDNVLEPGCDCPTCSSGKSRADLRAGLKAGDTQTKIDLMVHNVRFVARLMENMRLAIAKGELKEASGAFLGNFGGPIHWG